MIMKTIFILLVVIAAVGSTYSDGWIPSAWNANSANGIPVRRVYANNAAVYFHSEINGAGAIFGYYVKDAAKRKEMLAMLLSAINSGFDVKIYEVSNANTGTRDFTNLQIVHD